MQLNSSTRYAIQILIYLAQNKRIVPSMELSEITTVSQRYLLQIAGKLRDSGLIGVNRGMTGGFHLLMEPSQINVFDIIKYMEGGVAVPERGGFASDENNLLFDAFYLLNNYLEAFLQAMTINRLSDKGDDEWLMEIALLVERHINSLKKIG